MEKKTIIFFESKAKKLISKRSGKAFMFFV